MECFNKNQLERDYTLNLVGLTPMGPAKIAYLAGPTWLHEKIKENVVETSWIIFRVGHISVLTDDVWSLVKHFTKSNGFLRFNILCGSSCA